MSVYERRKALLQSALDCLKSDYLDGAWGLLNEPSGISPYHLRVQNSIAAMNPVSKRLFLLRLCLSAHRDGLIEVSGKGLDNDLQSEMALVG